MISVLESEARDFAKLVHGEQKRKYTGELYVDTHLKNVAELVRLVEPVPEMLAAAWLHDVIEDTDFGLSDIVKKCGAAVGSYVYQLTESRGHTRSFMKAVYRSKMEYASPGAKTIKLADLIDNMKDIVERDPKFAKIYLAEKGELLPVLV